MTSHTEPRPSFKTSIYNQSDITDLSVFFYSLLLILLISFPDLLSALSSAAGVRFNPPGKFAPFITN